MRQFSGYGPTCSLDRTVADGPNHCGCAWQRHSLRRASHSTWLPRQPCSLDRTVADGPNQYGRAWQCHSLRRVSRSTWLPMQPCSLDRTVVDGPNHCGRAWQRHSLRRVSHSTWLPMQPCSLHKTWEDMASPHKPSYLRRSLRSPCRTTHPFRSTLSDWSCLHCPKGRGGCPAVQTPPARAGVTCRLTLIRGDCSLCQYISPRPLHPP
jgi:hypothetical protein